MEITGNASKNALETLAHGMVIKAGLPIRLA
jgi:hypothetical protein